ncbi:MAG: hypothetical protein U0Q22_05415 [Acidimicrobiales bacterium]
MTAPQSFPDRIWKDADGHQAVAQRPNLPIVVWAVSRLLCAWVFDSGWPERLFTALAFGALFTWAWLELFHGDAYIRRVFGLVVLGALLYAKVR